MKQIVYLYIQSFPFIFHMSYLAYFQVKTLALQFFTT
ncbi:GntR family transcriptional regulator [Bacillus thuringiensis]|uniref:GntR family transcriptional regulator n=1 Tax=Bacillus thuringiensis TaxID=1428 RepID=A0AB35PKG8_BACTU|nr:GntR family transcriptional regulator [Bacillus sp. BB56-3]KAA8488770.1 GntR family transcriptional regulator [Bacillus thuringiensis]OTX68540.1 GntR family transcriptional regulator [Bacillus thuringiensis serovar novosibirsk]OTZ55843.1 GntR family transcriptional regulator [Bacillus thuringiensis serovar israelensis]PEV00923.1 GntR family transcriptional regulator [Bacillus sp. AFS012607]TKI27394.1 GntR family transcriptional regulator [Bacillus cereus]